MAIEHRYAEGRYERLPALAAELVGLTPAAILASPTQAALAAKAATSIIPIVFTTGFDPVRIGLVANLNRPGRNLTGVTYRTGQLGAKKLNLLQQLLPNVKKIGVLVNPSNPIRSARGIVGGSNSGSFPWPRDHCCRGRLGTRS